MQGGGGRRAAAAEGGERARRLQVIDDSRLTLTPGEGRGLRGSAVPGGAPRPSALGSGHQMKGPARFPRDKEAGHSWNNVYSVRNSYDAQMGLQAATRADRVPPTAGGRWQID